MVSSGLRKIRLNVSSQAVLCFLLSFLRSHQRSALGFYKFVFQRRLYQKFGSQREDRRFDFRLGGLRPHSCKEIPGDGHLIVTPVKEACMVSFSYVKFNFVIAVHKSQLATIIRHTPLVPDKSFYNCKIHLIICS